MNDFIDDIEPCIEINFKCQKDDQKKLIKFMLHFGNITINELAEFIEENIQILHDVIRGQASLSERSIINLTQLFYMFAHSCEFES